MSLSVRRLGPDDADAYRQMRLDCLRVEPSAFGADLGEEEAQSAEDWRAILGQSERVFFGLFAAGTLAGIANFLPETAKKAAHKGWVLGVYVDPAHRGRGGARVLIGEVIAHARGRVIQLHLGVGTSNLAALGLYEGLGFKRYGTEPRSLLVDGKYIDEHQMVLFLDKETKV